MKKIIFVSVVVSLGVIGSFLPDSERVKAEPKVVVELLQNKKLRKK